MIILMVFLILNLVLALFQLVLTIIELIDLSSRDL